MPNKGTTNGADWTNQYTEAMKNFQMPNMDMESLMASYRKNMEVFVAAQRQSMEAMQQIAKTQTEFAQRMMNDTREHCQNLVATKSLEERAKLHSEKIRESMDSAMNHSRTVAEAWQKTSADIGEKLQSRFKENIQEAQDVAKKATKKQS